MVSAALLSIFFASFHAEFAAPRRLDPAADRVRTCGLGASFHAGRRTALCERLGEGVVVLRGLPDTRDYREFRQDKSFWYLTGVESRDAALVMDAASGRAVLLLPERDRELQNEEVWNGEIWDASDEWVPGLTGFVEVRANGKLLDVVSELRGDAPDGVIWVLRYPAVQLAESSDRAQKFEARRRSDPLDGRDSRTGALEGALEARFPDAQVRDLQSELVALRVHKTPEELAALRRAAASSVAAMNEAIRSTKPGIGEWDLDALMSFVHQRNGAEGPAYEAIVGGGPNALVLHYLASDRVLRPNEMLLVDYACERDHYTCDITRSWPTSGEFTPRMLELYDAVLAAQLAGIAAAKPGVSLAEVSRVFRAGRRGRGFDRLVLQGACHFVGMEVHDPGNFREPLRPGACFTIEPGLYDPEAAIGIRIEDVICITEDGCEVLTAGSPKERAALLALRDEPGLLDRIEEHELDLGRRSRESEAGAGADR